MKVLPDPTCKVKNPFPETGFKIGDKVHLKRSAFKVIPGLDYDEIQSEKAGLTIVDMFEMPISGPKLIEVWFKELKYVGVSTKDIYHHHGS
jgi:transcription antitermination factor NusG